MREILFKGKTIKEGKWIEGSLIIDEKDNYYIGKYIESKGDCSYYCTNRRDGKTLNRFIGIGFTMVDKDTVCEYTQLKDKNGKRIWENDIVKTKFGRLCKMVWRQTQYFVGWDFVVCDFDFGVNDFSKPPSSWDLYLPENLEVVGNSIDNPELLTAERIGENEN
jgi:uncharacterized phage protein (TIGR01671 family)